MPRLGQYSCVYFALVLCIKRMLGLVPHFHAWSSFKSTMASQNCQYYGPCSNYTFRVRAKPIKRFDARRSVELQNNFGRLRSFSLHSSLRTRAFLDFISIEIRMAWSGIEPAPSCCNGESCLSDKHAQSQGNFHLQTCHGPSNCLILLQTTLIG